MSTPLVVTHTQGRMRLPTLRTVMIAGLVGNVLVNTILQAASPSQTSLDLSAVVSIKSTSLAEEPGFWQSCLAQPVWGS